MQFHDSTKTIIGRCGAVNCSWRSVSRNPNHGKGLWLPLAGELWAIPWGSGPVSTPPPRDLRLPARRRTGHRPSTMEARQDHRFKLV
jgi:hypothetical protein